jgi:hypothetical protein
VFVRFVRPAQTPGLEIAHYGGLSHGWRGIPDTYTPFLFIKSLSGDVEFVTRGIRTGCKASAMAIGEPGEPCVLRPRSPMLGDFQVVRVDNQVVGAALDEIGIRSKASAFPAYRSAIRSWRVHLSCICPALPSNWCWRAT